MNNWNAIGRVGAKDAETRFTQAGKQVTGWSLAVDTGWGDKKQTVWVDCSLWGERGGKVAEFITKGSQLGVSGELGTREHDGKTYITLNVANVTLIGSKEGGQGRSQQAPRQQRSEPEPASDFQDDNLPF